MNGYSQRRLKMLRGTLVFGGTRGSGLPASGQKWLGVVTQSVAQIDLLSSGKTGGADSAHGGVVASGAAFEQMFKLMKRIHETADAIDHDDDLPDIADDFPLPAGRNLQTWLTAAQTYHDKAAPVAQHFVDYGMKADFLTQLAALKTKVANAEGKQEAGDQADTGATPAIEAQLRKGVRAVRSLGAIVQNVFEDDPQVLREWASASDIEDDPQHAAAAGTTTTPA